MAISMENILRSLAGSNADRARDLARWNVGLDSAANTASPATLAAEARARSTGKPEDYEAALAMGKADMANATGGMVGGPLVVGGGGAVNAVKNAVIQSHVDGYASANAAAHVKDFYRPNCWVSLLTADPTVVVGAAASTGVLSETIPGKCAIVALSMLEQDSDFLIVTLKINGWDSNKGGAGAHIELFKGVTRRDMAMISLVGHIWVGTITVEGTFLNTAAAGKIFHGMTIGLHNVECYQGADNEAIDDIMHVTGPAFVLRSAAPMLDSIPVR